MGVVWSLVSQPAAVPQENVIDKELHTLFHALDVNGDSVLTNDELAALFVENGESMLSPSSVASLMARYNARKEPPKDAW